MRIKSLTLQGFKSFADKEVIFFNNGISCIVGPNGSGKSNILDAIKWILGEQNIKELRGGDIDDLIFNGSKSREPSNIVTVTLTLTDIDENIASKWGSLSEISITRKYYRSGEREYYINNKKCRLKDIKEFFYDIGISHKSIVLIEQGKVDKIVQANPEELREIFEEFSGIVNYKDKKKEAQKKLESTKINLDRIKDIYLEVENSKRSFSKQIEELKKYRKYINDKKVIQKTLFSINYKHIIETLKKINTEKDIIAEKKSILEKELNNTVKVYEDKLHILSSLKKEYEVINERLFAVRGEISKNKSNRKITEEKINLYKEEKAKLEERVSSLKDEVEETKDKLNLLSGSVHKVNTDFVEIKNNKEQLEIKQKKILANINTDSSELKEIEKNIYQIMDEAKIIDQDIYEKTINIKTIENEQMRISNEKEHIKIEKDDYIKKYNEISLKAEELLREHSLLKKQLENKQLELKQAKKSYDIEYKKLNEKEHNKRNIENRIMLLKNLIEQIIVGESKTYKNFIEKFLYTPLIDKIQMTDTSEIICYGNVVVFKDALKSELMKLYDSEFWPIKFIFEGELEEFINKISTMSTRIERKNLIYNGLYYEGRNINDKREELIKYRQELKNLEVEKYNLESAIKIISENLSKIDNALKGKEIAVNDNINQINRLTIILEKVTNEKYYCDRELKKLNGRLKVIDKEEVRLQEELVCLREHLERDKKDKEKINISLLELNRKSKIFKGKIEKLNKEYAHLNKIIVSTTIKYKELIKEKEVLERMHNENRINLTKKFKEQLDLENKIKDYNESLIILANAEIEFNKELSVLMKNSEELEKRNRDLLHEIELFDLNIKDIKSEIDRLSDEIKGIDIKYNKYMVNEAKLLSDKDNLESQYMHLYNNPISEEYKNFYKKENQKNLSDKLTKIDEEIDKLGFINMGAEVEYKKLEERSLFLNNQINDLEGAVEKISEMIYNFDKDSVNRFNETFQQVKENFKKVVQMLFEGGSADMKVLNDGDLLNSGIEIYIQPPGKKLQNMNLLSGGEKALMSCALLFAFFLYRKAPFCFLDEVDAPLDDANISRFLHIVKTLSSDTQFFIISHNYNTMVESDSIYGITIKEPGISGVYSLRKEDFAEVNQ